MVEGASRRRSRATAIGASASEGALGLAFLPAACLCNRIDP
jgi:hypothetical protein